MGWRKVLLAISIGLNCILLYALVWGNQGALAYRIMKDQYQNLADRIVDLEKKNTALGKEIYLLQNDTKYQEKIIRNRLNYVKNNEILYIFPADTNVDSSGATENEAKN